MAPLRAAAIAFTLVAALCLIGGGASLSLGAEAADNECRDDGADPCRGRDARAQGFRETGQFLLWGGFFVLALAALLVILGARTDRRDGDA
jgi:hypothetical protein